MNMTKVDSIKATLDLIKLFLTTFIGFLLVIFWGVNQNESLVNSMSEAGKLNIIFVVEALVVLIIILLIAYAWEVHNLEKED